MPKPRNESGVSTSELHDKSEALHSRVAVPTFYSNQVQISIAPFDFNIVFRLVRPDGSDLMLTDIAQVFVSPQHAKSILRIFELQVAKYEQRYGEISEDAVVIEMKKSTLEETDSQD